MVVVVVAVWIFQLVEKGKATHLAELIKNHNRKTNLEKTAKDYFKGPSCAFVRAKGAP